MLAIAACCDILYITRSWSEGHDKHKCMLFLALNPKRVTSLACLDFCVYLLVSISAYGGSSQMMGSLKRVPLWKEK